MTFYLIFFLACVRVHACPAAPGARDRVQVHACPDSAGARDELLALDTHMLADKRETGRGEVKKRRWGVAPLLKSGDPHVAGGEKYHFTIALWHVHPFAEYEDVLGDPPAFRVYLPPPPLHTFPSNVGNGGEQVVKPGHGMPRKEVSRRFIHHYFWSSILDPRFSIPDSRFSILNSPFSILNSRSSIQDPRSSLPDSRSSIFEPRFTVLDRHGGPSGSYTCKISWDFVRILENTALLPVMYGCTDVQVPPLSYILFPCSGVCWHTLPFSILVDTIGTTWNS